MPITRRSVTQILLAAPAFAALPSVAPARSNLDWAEGLTAALNKRLEPGCDGRFRVTAFGQFRRDDGKYHFATVVRLDWPPGFRTRRYDAIRDTEDEAFRQLFLDAHAHFSGAWPECVV